MMIFTLICGVILFLLVPLLCMCVYGYTQENGWKPLLFGGGWQILTQIILRLLIPLLFAKSAWFLAFSENTLLFSLCYAALQTILILSAYCLSIWRFGRQPEYEVPSHPGLVFGLSWGVLEGALFVGFGCLSALLSTNGDSSLNNAGQLWQSMIESFCLIFLYGWLGWKIEKVFHQEKGRKSLPLLVLALAVFVLLAAGYLWTTVFRLPQVIRMILLIAAALLALRSVGSELWPDRKFFLTKKSS